MALILKWSDFLVFCIVPLAQLGLGSCQGYVVFTKGGPDFSSRLRVDIIMAHLSVSGSGPHSYWIHPGWN